MALYAYKKRKPKIIKPKVKRPVFLPATLFLIGLTLLAYISFPYLSYYLSQTFKVDNLSKELLSPQDNFKVYASEDTSGNDNYDKNVSANIAEVNKEIQQNADQYADLSNEKGKMYITIDKLGLKHIPIVINVLSNQESDYNPILGSSIAHFKGTSLPGHPGKTFLYGHSARGVFNNGPRTFSTGIFTDIDKLNLGDEFTIEYKDKVYKYSVYRTKLVEKDDISVVYGDDKRKTVSLMTCVPPGIGVQRFVVEALEEDEN